MKISPALVFLFVSMALLSSCEKGPTFDPKTPNYYEDSLRQAIIGTYRLDKAKMSALGRTYPFDLYAYVTKDSVYFVELDTFNINSLQYSELDPDRWISKSGYAVDQVIGPLQLTRNGHSLEMRGQQESEFYMVADLPPLETLVTSKTASNQIKLPKNSMWQGSDMTVIGDSVYMIDWSTEGGSLHPVLYTINKNSHEIIDSITVEFYSNGGSFSVNFTGAICAVDGYLWIENARALEKIDPLTGKSVFRTSTIKPSSFSESLAYNGTDLILAYHNGSLTTFIRYNISNNTAVQFLELPVRVSAIDFIDGKLAIVRDKHLSICSLNPFNVEKNYELRSNDCFGNVRGMIHFDNTLWISRNSCYGEYPGEIDMFVIN